MGRKPKEQTSSLANEAPLSLLNNNEEQEYFNNYYKYVKSMIPELNNGKISEDQSQQIAKTKWNMMTATEKRAYCNVSEQQSKVTQKLTKAQQKNMSTKQTVAPVIEEVEVAIKPKKAMHPYLCYITKSAKLTSERDGIPFREAFTKCAALWQTLTEEQKQPYVDEAAKDQERANREQKEFKETGFFTNSDGINSSTLKKTVKQKKTKDQDIQEDSPAKTKRQLKADKDKEMRPKKAMVAFMFLVKTMSKQVMAENKEECKSAAGAIKILGERWRNMTAEEKAPYVKMSEDDKLRHDKQLLDFNKQGWFTLANGSKSNDQANVKLGKRARQDSSQADDVKDESPKKQKLEETES